MAQITITDLLQHLTDKWQFIENRYASAFETLGRKLYHNKETPGCWPVQEQVGEITKMFEEQNEIAILKNEIVAAEREFQKSLETA